MSTEHLNSASLEYRRGRAIVIVLAAMGPMLVILGAVMCFRWFDDTVLLLLTLIVAKSMLSGDLWTRWSYPLCMAAEVLLKLLYLNQAGPLSPLSIALMAFTAACGIAACLLLCFCPPVRAFMAAARQRHKDKEKEILDEIGGNSDD